MTTQGPKPRRRRLRPPTLTERSWPWTLLTVLVSAAVAVGAYADLKRIQGSSGPTAGASFLIIAILGILAVLLMAVTAVYSLRKRRRGLQEHMPGTMMSWLKSHVWLGLLALVVATVHALGRPLPAGYTTGKVTFLLLFALVVSGILWRIVYLVVPPGVAGAVGNLSLADTAQKLADVRVQLDKLTAGRSEEFQGAVTDLLASRRSQAELDRAAASFEVAERAAWRDAVGLAERRRRYERRERGQRRYGAILQGWKFLHLPLAGVLVGMIAIHVLSVLGVVRLGSNGEANGFASSAQCAGCHTTITDQWQLSMMAHSQLSPIDIAQTRLALQKDPKIGAFCVNCHAPIGSQVTGLNILPLAPSGSSLALNEGVNCAACHLVTGLPGIRRGGFANFPIEPTGKTSLGTVLGPPLASPNPVPVPDHDVSTGFMTSPVAASQLCGACHVVEADLNGDGKIDQNHDLILQRTFFEWRDFIRSQGGNGESCVSCHMPASSGRLVQGSGLLAPPTRTIDTHTFVGVDYDLAPGAYPNGGFAQVLAERARLLAQAASVSVATSTPKTGTLVASVSIENADTGHDLPTGFAFVRQMWLEVSARTTSGKPVCLRPVALPAATGKVVIGSPCASGVVASAQEDLKTCDPRQIPGDINAKVKLTRASPLTACDPWLTNFQKILTDGDPKGTGTITEVAYQSLLPGIVKLESRAATPTVQVVPIQPKKTERFDYAFDVSGLQPGTKVVVTVRLRFRHLPPYFVRELGPFYPPGITVPALLHNLAITDMARASSPPARVG